MQSDVFTAQGKSKEGFLGIDTISKLQNSGFYFSPVKVNYRKVMLQRGQLMEMKKTLLEKCEEVIESTYWPFIKSNLKT